MSTPDERVRSTMGYLDELAGEYFAKARRATTPFERGHFNGRASAYRLAAQWLREDLGPES